MDYPVLELGGVLNSGWSLKQVGLFVSGAVFVAAGLGSFLTGGKTHSELQRDAMRKRRAAMKQMKALGMIPESVEIPGEDDEEEQSFDPRHNQAHQPPPPAHFEHHHHDQQAQNANAQRLVEQKMLQMLIERAVMSERQGLFGEAGKRYREAAAILTASPSGAAAMVPLILELLISSAKSFMEAGMAMEAKNTLQQMNIEAVLQSFGERLKYATNLESILITLRDPEVLGLIDSVKEMCMHNEGPDSEHVAAQYVALGDYNMKINNLEEAEKAYQQALDIHTKTNVGPTLKQPLLDSYLSVIRVNLKRGDLSKALGIQEDIAKLCDHTDVSYNWHLCYVAIACLEFQFFDNAKQIYQTILDRYGDLDKAKHHTKAVYEQIVNLVASVCNDYGVLCFNLGDKDLYTSFTDRVKDEKWAVLTNSAYMESRSATILFLKEDNGENWNGNFFISLRLKDNVKPKMFVEVKFDVGSEYEDTVTYEIEPSQFVLILNSNPRKIFTSPVYDVAITLYEDSTKESLLHTHMQTIPSSAKTTGNESWNELQMQFS